MLLLDCLCFLQGFVMNMQPSEAEAGFDARLPPTVDPDLIRRRIAEEWAPAIRNMSYEVNCDLSVILFLTYTNL